MDFEHPATVRAIQTEADHDLALAIIDRLVDDGAMINEDHPDHELFIKLFDAIDAYEVVHFPL